MIDGLPLASTALNVKIRVKSRKDLQAFLIFLLFVVAFLENCSPAGIVAAIFAGKSRLCSPAGIVTAIFAGKSRVLRCARPN